MMDPVLIASQLNTPDKNAGIESGVSKSEQKDPLNSAEIKLLLKNTLKLINQEGLASVNPSKILSNIKQLLPSAHTQINFQIIQENKNQSSHIQQSSLISEDTIKRWSDGQMLKAKVIDVQKNNTVTVSINNKQLNLQLPANIPIEFKSEQQLNLQVVKTENPDATVNTQLQLKNDPKLSHTLAQSEKMLKNPQISMNSLLASLDTIEKQISINSKYQTTINYPKEFIQAVQQVINNFASQHQLSNSQSLKNIIASSGIFLENNIKQLAKSTSTHVNLAQTLESLVAKVSALEKTPDIQNISLIQFNKHLSNFSQALLQVATPNGLSNKNIENINSLVPQLKNNSSIITVKEALTLIKGTFQEFQQALTSTNKTFQLPKQLLNQSQQLTQAILSQFQDKTVANLPGAVNQQSQQILQSVSQQLAQLQNPLTAQQLQVDFKVSIEKLITVLKQLPTEIKTIDSQIPKTLSETLEKSFFREEMLPTLNKHAQVVKSLQQALTPIMQLPLFQQQLIEQLENTLSRIIATQINMREQGEQQNMLSVELPFKYLDKTQILQMKIKAKQKQNEAKGKIWTANLAFELSSLGGIRIYITLDNHDVAIQFWTEKEETQKIFQNQFSLLTHRISAAGYKVFQLIAYHGIPGEAQEEIEETKSTQYQSDALVDEHV